MSHLSHTLVYDQINDVPISQWEELLQVQVLTHSRSSSTGRISNKNYKYLTDIKMRFSPKTCSQLNILRRVQKTEAFVSILHLFSKKVRNSKYFVVAVVNKTCC